MSSDIASGFANLKATAQSNRNALFADNKPIIMVGAATCGRAAGALDVIKSVKDELGERIADCHLMEVGCIGHCYAEPIVVIWRVSSVGLRLCYT